MQGCGACARNADFNPPGLPARLPFAARERLDGFEDKMTLIKQIQLPNGRSTSNLGFGCAGLLRLPTGRRRENLLRTAVEEGVTHFDVARMYGLGAAEGIVGSSLKSSRDQITLATKFGLPYAPTTPSSLKIQSLGRWILNLSPSLKSKIKELSSKGMVSTHQPASSNNYSIEEMEKSLDLSLQQLQTDRVDILFIHEPGMNDFIPENMSEALQQKKTAKKIGAFGISAGRAELEHFLKTRPDLCGEAIQYRHLIFKTGPEADPLRCAFSGMFGVMSDTLAQLDAYLSANKTFTKSWSDKLGIALETRENAGIIILAIALTLNPQGLVLFFTSNPKRLRQIVRRLTDNSFSEENLLAFRQAVIQGIHAN